ncbi:hydrogenase 4 subunit B [Herbaspirillum sp. ST 5-3]|uniref:hydrogenase 4 subunit B n=1 Tax=Oxalobacteraceae TaxID=75682 RepID=UPI001FFE8452|nr:hydrogenase 4 subunit B [Herbaspirillum sp. ST 5-3]
MTDLGQLDYILFVIAGWFLIGTCGLFVIKHTTFVARVLFPLGALLGIFLGATGLAGIWIETPQTMILPLGLPDLPFHLRLDSLSSYFLFVFGIVSTGVSVFSAGYFRKGEGTPPGLLCLEYHVCLASMALLLVADDAYVFMVAWETMTLSATLLVMANHRIPEVRRAGFLYILISHVGALALLLCFGLLQANTGDYTFANMRQQHLSMFWASIAFFLALFGFGAKAGILPLHVWLPEAHPAAPSPISALMSAFVLKTGVYGVLRVTFDLLNEQVWWWGGTTMAIGLATALFGVVLCTVQTDMKRLLAYSSIENIGLIFVGIGLTILFRAYGMSGLAALSLTASLYHIATHGAFKSLLFLGTGTVLHATGERNLGRLGGLLRFMPWTGWAALIGALAAAGLPPLGGFVSEWLLLQSFLFTPGLPNSFLNMLIPIVAAVIALVGALAGYVMVKFFGVIFLGQPREPKLNEAHDADTWERLGFGWLVAACIFLGLFPVQLVQALDRVTHFLVGDGIAEAVTQNGWLMLAPVAPDRASYAPAVFVMMLLACCMLAFMLVRRLYHGRFRRSPPWACGFPIMTARMQDTAEGFGQPIREIFSPFFRMTRELPTAFDKAPRYRVTVEDPFWQMIYRPIARLTERVARLVGLLQQGRIAVYLLYSFLTLLLMLLLVTR